MTTLLERAIAEVRQLSQPQQDEIATIMLDLAGAKEHDFFLTPDQIAEIERRLSEDEPFATEAEVRETFDRLAR